MVILAGDHIYKMDYELMLRQHVDAGADVTVGCLEVPRMEATGFGVMHVDEQGQHHRLRREAGRSARHSRTSRTSRWPRWASTCSRRKFLMDQLRRDAADPNSSRDFGKDIIPYIVKNGKAVAHRFAKSCVRSSAESEAYWRDVGTVDAYWEANIDLTDVTPELDLYDRDWPIWTYAEITPPAKFVHDEEGRRGSAVSSLVSGDCIVSGASLQRSLLFTGVARQFLLDARGGGGAARLRCRPQRAAEAVVIDRGVQHSRRAGRRRGSGARRQALPPHRERHLPDHPGDDRQAGA